MKKPIHNTNSSMNKLDTWRIRCRTRKFEIGSAELSRSDSECLSNMFCSWIHTVNEVNRLVHHTQPQATGPLNQIRLQQCLHSYSDALAAEYVNGHGWGSITWYRYTPEPTELIGGSSTGGHPILLQET